MNISEKLNSLPSSAILRIFKIRNPDLVSDTTGRKEKEGEEEQHRQLQSVSRKRVKE